MYQADVTLSLTIDYGGSIGPIAATVKIPVLASHGGLLGDTCMGAADLLLERAKLKLGKALATTVPNAMSFEEIQGYLDNVQKLDNQVQERLQSLLRGAAGR